VIRGGRHQAERGRHDGSAAQSRYRLRRPHHVDGARAGEPAGAEGQRRARTRRLLGRWRRGRPELSYLRSHRRRCSTAETSKYSAGRRAPDTNDNAELTIATVSDIQSGA
jgi:hypothetical protein